MSSRPFKGRSSRLEMVIERIHSKSGSQESDSSPSTSHTESECNSGVCEACNRSSDCDCSQKTLPFPLGRNTTGTQFPTPVSDAPESPRLRHDPDNIIDLTTPTNRSPILIHDGSPKPPSPIQISEVIEVQSSSQSPASINYSPSPPPAPPTRNYPERRSRQIEYSPERTESETSRSTSAEPPGSNASPSGGVGVVSSTVSPKTFTFAAPPWNPPFYELRANPFISAAAWPVNQTAFTPTDLPPAAAIARATIEIPAFTDIYTPHGWGQVRFDNVPPTIHFQAQGVPYGNEPQPSTSGLVNNRHYPMQEDEYVDSDSVEENEAESLPPEGYEGQRPSSTWPDMSRPGSRYMQHSEQSQFDCLHCPRKFKHKRSRDRHLKLHTGDKKYKCRECNAAFARSDHLKIHIRTHAANHRRQRPFKCQHCDTGYDSAAALAFHEQSHAQENAEPRRPSWNPRSSWNNNNNNNNNSNNWRSLSSRNGYDCSHCSDVFNTSRDLAKHIVSVRTEQLFEEKMKEMMEKMYTCMICKKRFVSCKEMEEHLRKDHLTGERNTGEDRTVQQENASASPVAPEPDPSEQNPDATDASRQSPQSGTKRKAEEATAESKPEKRTCDDDNPDKTYICSNCFAELPDFQSFLQHMEIHMVVPSTSEDTGHGTSTSKPRKVVSTLDNHNCCCQCEKIFDEPEEFLNHMAWDHVKPVYKCAICTEICDDKMSMKEHMKEAHTQRHYRCNMCTESYAIFHDAIAAKQHITTAHSRAKQQKPETALNNSEHVKKSDDRVRCKACKRIFPDLAAGRKHICKPVKEGESSTANGNDKEETRPGPPRPSSRELPERPNLEEATKTNDRAKELMKDFPTMASLNNKCPYCNEQCKSRSEFVNHLRSRHQPTDKMYKCNICDELFESVEKLATHKLKHCKIFRGDNCVQCKEAVNHRELFFTHLFKHNVTYANDKRIFCLPFICVVCSQTLQSKLEVALHAAYHMKYVSHPHAKDSNCLKCNRPLTPNVYGENSVVCDDCIAPDHQDGSQVNENRIKTPKNEVMLSEEILSLHCHLCKKSLESKEKLQTHLIEHNFFGMNEYSCYVCSSVFTAATGLQTHLLEHKLSEMPYQCSTCKEGFLFRTELENHGYIHILQAQVPASEEHDQEKKTNTVSRDVSTPCEAK